MAELKTKPTGDSIDSIVAAITPDTKREDFLALLAMMERVTGDKPVVWSSGLVGFGTYRYKYASGREGEWFPVGLAARKTNLTVYLGPGLVYAEELLGSLGKYKSGKSCLYIKRLSDIDMSVLEQLVADSYARIRELYG